MYKRQDKTTTKFEEGTTLNEEGTVTGDYVAGVQQEVVYNYFKTEVVTTKGTFKETHKYTEYEKDFDGNNIEEKTKEEVVEKEVTEGTSKETYKTKQEPKDGYELTNVEGTGEHNKDGSEAEGNYLSLIHISEPTRREWLSRMPSSA